jgi:hypothetical protein
MGRGATQYSAPEMGVRIARVAGDRIPFARYAGSISDPTAVPRLKPWAIFCGPLRGHWTPISGELY